MPREPEFIDSELQALFNDARQYQDLLDTTDVSNEEIIDIIRALDTQWPYHGQLLKISGRITTWMSDAGENNEQQYSLKHDVPVDEIEVVSQGFIIYSQPVEIEGEQVAERWRVGHTFTMGEGEPAQAFLLKNTMTLYGCAPLSDIMIEYPHQSAKVLGEKLNYFYPDIMEELDSRVLNAANECDAVESLHDFKIPVKPEDSQDELRTFVEYLDQVISFDKNVPYRMKLSGLIYVQHDDDNVAPRYVQDLNLFGYPESIKLVRSAELRRDTLTLAFNEAEYEFALKVNVLSDDKERDGYNEILIPLSGELAISSIRKKLAQRAFRQQPKAA